MFSNTEVGEQLRARLRLTQSDLIICHNLYPVISPIVYQVAKDENIPLIQYIHNFRPFSVSGSLWTGEEVATESLNGNYFREIVSGGWQGSQIKSLVMAAVLKSVHRSNLLKDVSIWIAISEFMRSKFIEAGVEASKVVTLRHSWDSKPEIPRTSDDGYYLFLGRLVKEKGIRSLLEAWRLLENEMGPETPLLQIAGSGSEEAIVKKVAEGSSFINFCGFVDGEEKEELIAGCRAMLAPSIWWEPLGLVTYEAYDYGKPVVAASSGGIVETIQDGITGFLHKPNNSCDLMTKVLKMEQLSSQERQQMGLAGRSWLLDEASPERWRSDFNDVLARFR